MNEPLMERLDDPELPHEPLEVAQPRAVGSPLPRGNGMRVHLPPNYDELENQPPSQKTISQAAPQPISQPGPVLAPPPAASIPSEPSKPATESTPEPLIPPSPVRLGGESIPAFDGSVKATTPPPPRRLPAPPVPPATGFQRAVGAIRTALPFVQKLLPLLEGNVASAVSNILAPSPNSHPAPPPPPVDLAPLQKSIADLQTRHRDLREQVTEQNASLKRVEDRLESVREATDRNTLEQQELLADLKSMGRKVNLVAAIAIGLLAISLLVNLALFMHIQRVLP